MLKTITAIMASLIFTNAYALSIDTEKELNATYAQALKSSEPYIADLIKKSQRLWLKGRNQNCDLFLTDRGYDTDLSSDCINTQNKARTLFLMSFINH